jgi:endonuclease G
VYGKIIKLLSVIAAVIAAAGTVGAYDVNDGVYPEIHCKHFFYGYPAGTPTTNDMIIRDIYALSSNDTTKFADWVAYRLDEDTIEAIYGTRRDWKNDPWLAEDETLEYRPNDDYRGAYDALHTDRGHQAPLASFKGTTCWRETNYYSNITPQMSGLNQGPWKELEQQVRYLVLEDNVVYVMTGPLYERDMPALPEADETHRVPSGYWKIVAIQPSDDYSSIRIAAFIFDQNTPRSDSVIGHLVTIDDIESRSGLDFVRELPDNVEVQIQSNDFRTWAESYF